jgi:hypothetical protein
MVLSRMYIEGVMHVLAQFIRQGRIAPDTVGTLWY